MSKIVPIFYACDDNFVKYTIVSIKSLICNASTDRIYNIHILNTGISDEMKKEIFNMQSDYVNISFDDVENYLLSISDKLPIRDYYSKTTYYRLMIAEMFPEYEKAIYIDSDTVVLGDISQLFDTDIKDYFLAAAHEQVMIQVDVYGTYTEKVLGIDRNLYFNAGLLLLNCRQFRENEILDRFINLLHVYNFVVTQDQDYLNVICKDRVLWLNQQWNCEVFGAIPCREGDMKIIHYIMTSKPWLYNDCKYREYFWKYASLTNIENKIRDVLNSYTQAQKDNDALSGQRLLLTAKREIAREDNYLKIIEKNRNRERLIVLKKIEQLEKEGKFDVDVENDPPAKPLLADDIDYFHEGIINKIKTKIAFNMAEKFVDRLIKNKRLIIKDIKGIEYFSNLSSGAVITCNHFNAFDSFIIHLVYYAANQKNRKFYRVIKEGNYTNYPGFYGFLMKNCNTLPLSSNFKTFKKFMESTDKLLKDGHFVLVYPEQSMWWNYRKRKPLKDGAFRFAAKSNVPVLPCFITMQDSNILDSDGFFVQEYTVHICKPIYPDDNIGIKENTMMLKNMNFEEWKKIYESAYGIPLSYKITNETDEIHLDSEGISIAK